jgi:DNA-binding transcriptional LysR family regulator
MDRLSEMEAFAAVVDQGGFTDAARKMGKSKSAISKYVTSLEARLGARLLNRTTRRVNPTEIGLAYYDCARRILNDAGEADSFVTATQSVPVGVLRVRVATDFGVSCVSPLVSEFLKEFPDITVNMVLSNRHVELGSEGFDMAIRIGEPEDNSLRACQLTKTSKVMVASPSYVQKSGRPLRIDDLSEHKLLHYSNPADDVVWNLKSASGEMRQVYTAGWLTVNDGQSLLNAAISGLGIAYLPRYLCAGALEAGLVEEINLGTSNDAQGIFAVYPLNSFVQPKVRAFVDFLRQAFVDQAPNF